MKDEANDLVSVYFLAFYIDAVSIKRHYIICKRSILFKILK